MNTKLDFNKDLLFLDGTPVHETDNTGAPLSGTAIRLNKILANNLAQITKGGVKYFHWAIELYKTGILELDKVDLGILEKEISEMGVSNLVQGRLLEVFKSAK